jgi:creatinine amidohydrolase
MYMQQMNMDQFQQALEATDTAVLPIGMTEAHGHHCPLGTDTLIPRHFLQLIEQRLGEQLIIAPEIPYGHSWNLAPYPGTIDVSADAFGEYVFQVGRGLAKWGVRKLVLFNGHGGNIPALSIVMERLADLGLSVLLVNWWLDYAAEIRTICSGQGHAGEDETSCVLAIDPSLVDMGKANVNWTRAVANVKYPGISLRTLAFAQTGDATKATPEKGEAIYQLLTDRIVELLQRFRRDQLIEE